MVYLFPACYLRPTQTAQENADGEGSDIEDDHETDDGYTDNDDMEAPDVYHTKSQGLRKRFLSEFSDDEVAEMWQIHNFMMFASLCARNATPNSPIHDRVSLYSLHLVLHLFKLD